MKIPQTTKDMIKNASNGYAWPGGYPVFMVMTDGGCLCPACVNKKIKHILAAVMNNDKTGGWMPIGADINYEDDNLYCNNCGKQIEAAYC